MGWIFRFWEWKKFSAQLNKMLLPFKEISPLYYINSGISVKQPLRSTPSNGDGGGGRGGVITALAWRRLRGTHGILYYTAAASVQDFNLQALFYWDRYRSGSRESMIYLIELVLL